MTTIEPDGGGNSGPGWPMTARPHRDDHGWTSGPTGAEIELGIEPTGDPRPTYAAEVVVLGVIAQLSADGIEVHPTTAQRRVAALAAVNLLRALGVQGSTAERAR